MSFVEITLSEKAGINGYLGRVLNVLPSMVLVTDPEGRILYVNQYTSEQLGYSMDNLIGQPIWQIYKEPEKGRSLFQDGLRKMIRNTVYGFQAEAITADGCMKWLDVRIKYLGLPKGCNHVLWTASDISAIKMMEKDLAKSKARTEAILESTVEGIIAANQNGVILNANLSIERMFGYDLNELIGQKLEILAPDIAPYKSKVEEFGCYQMTLGNNRQFQGVRKNGNNFPVEIEINEINFENEFFITALIRDVSKRRELEQQVLKVAESERFKIGQELHDGVGQMLSAIALMTKNLSRKLSNQSDVTTDEIDAITEMIQETDQEIRQLAHGLAHIELQNEGLKVALKTMCERFQMLSQVDCHFICSPGINISDNMMALHLYRIVQEAINNAIKHGNANKIRVKLKKDDAHYLLTINDNGVGLFEKPNDKKFKGMGLSTMHYRAELLGGNFEINNVKNGWTQVKCYIPINVNIKNDREV